MCLCTPAATSDQSFCCLHPFISPFMCLGPWRSHRLSPIPEGCRRLPTTTLLRSGAVLPPRQVPVVVSLECGDQAPSRVSGTWLARSVREPGRVRRWCCPTPSAAGPSAPQPTSRSAPPSCSACAAMLPVPHVVPTVSPLRPYSARMHADCDTFCSPAPRTSRCSLAC